MSFLYATILLCKSFRLLAHSQNKLHCTKVGKSEVCGSPAFSNLITTTTLESSSEVTTAQHVHTSVTYQNTYTQPKLLMVCIYTMYIQQPLVGRLAVYAYSYKPQKLYYQLTYAS